jgi:hypothetical protein
MASFPSLVIGLLCAAAIIYGGFCLLVMELTTMSISIISLLLATAILAI